jgi:hypothetical protein
MNIQTAARYLEIGYRVRRTSWEPEEYLHEMADALEKIEVHYGSTYDKDTKQIVERRYVSKWGSINPLGLQDMLADDWEVITTGIRKSFNKYGNLEYIDEPDWDNYEPKGWDYEEDE